MVFCHCQNRGLKLNKNSETLIFAVPYPIPLAVKLGSWRGEALWRHKHYCCSRVTEAVGASGHTENRLCMTVTDTPSRSLLHSPPRNPLITDLIADHRWISLANTQWWVTLCWRSPLIIKYAVIDCVLNAKSLYDTMMHTPSSIKQ